MIQANSQPLISNCSLQKRTGGFTLIELMIAIAIVAILLTVAAPSFSQAIANHRVKAAATDIHMSLLKARSEATLRNTNVTITPDGGGWAVGWIVARGAVVIENHGPSKGVTISNPGTVTYRSSGRVQGSVALTVASESVSTVIRCVTADLSGRPYVKEGACS